MKKILYTTAISAVFNLNALDYVPDGTMSSRTTQSAPIATALSQENAYDKIMAAIENEHAKRKIVGKALEKYNDAVGYLNVTTRDKILSEEDIVSLATIKQIWKEECAQKQKNDQYSALTGMEHDKAIVYAEIFRMRQELHRLDIANAENLYSLIEKYCKKEHGEACKEYIEASKAYQESIGALITQCDNLDKAAFHEVLKVSRAPNDNEKAATDCLKNLLGLGINDEIRFMDATSLIKGMDFAKEKELEFLKFLNAQKGNKDAIGYIEEYLKTCTYTSENRKTADKRLKKEVMSGILDGCRESKTCQDSIITLIARTKMPRQFLYTGIMRSRVKSSFIPQDVLHFVRGKKWQSNCDNTITCANEKYKNGLQSLHYSYLSCGNVNDGLYCYRPYMNDPILHECGHSISGYLALYASISDTMNIASKFATIEKDCNAIKCLSEDIESCQKQKKENELIKNTSSQVRKRYKEEKDKGNPNALTMALIDYPTTPEGAAECKFSNKDEVFQIMGLGVWKIDGGRLLCINSLSDFASNMELGFPIRFGHLGFQNDSLLPQYRLVKYSKTPVYDALFPLFGSSIAEYEAHLEQNAKKEAQKKGCLNAVKRCLNWLSSQFRKK